MKKKKKPTECIMPGCSNIPRTRGLCSTHRENLYVHASVEVQRVVEEHERQNDIAGGWDWDYLTEDQRSAIERGVRDAYWENGRLQESDLDNMLQDAWIWAASHKAEVQKIRAVSILRRKVKHRIVEANLTSWKAEKDLDYLEDYVRPEVVA